MTDEPVPGTWLAKEQYRALQARADTCRKELAMLERLCVGGVVAAFIWLARDSDLYVDAAALVWFLPIIVAVYGALKAQAIDARISTLDQHIGRIETGLGALPGSAYPGHRRRWLLARLAWIAFVGLTTYIAVTGFEGTWTPGDEDGTEQTTTTA